MKKHFAARKRRRRLFAQTLEDRRLLAGPYAPAAGQVGSDAIAGDDPAIVGWAARVTDYSPGTEVEVASQQTTRALGPAQGTSGDVVTLGRGGSITLAFDSPIRDGLGADFAVFENSFSDTFLELAYVEVSSDGTNFFRFASDSLTAEAVESFGTLDPTNLSQLAGKYRGGFGTPFDLEALADIDPSLDVSAVTHVRIVDVVGDGSNFDSQGDPIYDPFPTLQTAGFDLDAVAVLREAENRIEVAGFEDVGATLASQSAFSGPVAGGQTVIGPFGDSVVKGTFQSESLDFNNSYSQDFGSWTQWAYSNQTDTTTAGFGNQFSAVAGSGAEGSQTYGVSFVASDDFYDPPTITRDPDDHRKLKSIWITNTTYSALSMRDGDSFAKKFGGPMGDDPDYFKLTVTGKDASSQPIGSVDFFLADYRFEDDSLDYIVDQWVEVDLSSIADARQLEFQLASSDVGPFGMNTPAFIAADNLTFTQPVLAIDLSEPAVQETAGPEATLVRITRPTNDTALPFPVELTSVDPSVAVLPTAVTIPAGDRYVEFPVEVIDNDLFHGDRIIEIEASAPGVVSATRTLTIKDDETRALTITASENTLNEGQSRSVTVFRNDADTSATLLVNLASSDTELLEVPSSVTIPVGQRSVTFDVVSPNDDLSRTETQQTVSAIAAGYDSVETVFTYVDDDPAALTISLDSFSLSESMAPPTIGLEDVGRRLIGEDFYNGSDLAGGFGSRGLQFSNQYNSDFGSWSGWSYSNTTDTTTPGFGNQYSAIVGQGAKSSRTYAVASTYGATTITRDPESSRHFQSIDITNTTYAALSMLEGDAFAKAFGGESGSDPDYFLLSIEGRDATGTPIGTVEFYLADYRFQDDAQDYVVDAWTTVDLTPIGDAVELAFSLTSSDVGDWGMNTPAYFAADNITLASASAGASLTVHRNTADISEPLDVELASSDSTELRVPSNVQIPAGESSLTIPVTIVDDAVVDGNRNVSLTAKAGGFVSGTQQTLVADDETRALTLTLFEQTLSEDEGRGRGVLHRNVADLSSELRVALSSNPSDEVALPAEVVIPAGQAAVAFEYAAIDNTLVDPDRSVTLEASASGYQTGSASVTIENEDVPPPSLELTIDRQSVSEADAPTTVMLEDLGARLPTEGFDNGSSGDAGFLSGPVHFNNLYDPEFGSWGGWAISNTTDNTTPGFLNQYSSVAGGGALGSPTYAVASAFPGGLVPTLSLEEPADGRSFDSLMITNTTYAALSMRDGDAFAKKFGGESGDDSDFLLLTIEGFDGEGKSVGAVEFALADYRFEDNSQDYIVDQWTRVDVSSLLGATELQFSLQSSDNGTFGMNTPAYFALDQIMLSPEIAPPAQATVTRRDSSLDESLLVAISTDDASELAIPSTVVIPAGEASITFPLIPVDDALDDGDQQVTVSVEAESHRSASLAMTVADDDEAKLTVTLLQDELTEGSDGTAELLIHRNSADVSSGRSLSFPSLASEIILGGSVEIPAGQSRVLVDVSVADNVIREGDRSHSIVVASEGFEDDNATLAIVDDETSVLRLHVIDGETRVSEASKTDRFGVSLASRPLGPVTLQFSAPDGEIELSRSGVTIAPEQWEEIHWVDVSAIRDLEIDPEPVSVIISVDSETTTELYREAPDRSVDVTVEDWQPTKLQLARDASSVFLVDRESGARILEVPIDRDLDINASSLAQDLQIDSLDGATANVRIEMGGGDDSVQLRSSWFQSLGGGDGNDTLEIGLNHNFALAALLDSRIHGFERIVIDSPAADSIEIDLAQIDSAIDAGRVTLRLAESQQLRFVGSAAMEAPVAVAGEFAQVVSTGSQQIFVVTPRPWQNVLNRWDVNRNGEITSLDALAVINELARRSDPELPPLVDPAEFPGSYFDVSGEGRLTALDALQVINEMSRQQLQPESERLPNHDPPLAMRKDWQRAEADASFRDTQPLATGWNSESSSSDVASFDMAIRELTEASPIKPVSGEVESASSQEIDSLEWAIRL